MAVLQGQVPTRDLWVAAPELAIVAAGASPLLVSLYRLTNLQFPWTDRGIFR